ncbi:hypothetical protein [Myroides marinus]|uniref:hypothetical protein n=1 Tax=Myroides marinus TaxID=703342 RepID=UPI0025767DCA|nr:hypothetical protein [Myroides marinus]MDM1375171.1 hypothetical protein [Myroides marinus]MDM1404867.1 hypothetical protein [Myroides marinus]
MKKFSILFLTLLSISMFGQVGVGTEEPTAGLDIDPKGIEVEKSEDRYIRLEGLEKKPDYLRKIVLNQKGDVATMDYDANSFNLKTIKYAKSKKTIHTEKSANVMDVSKKQVSLDVDLVITLSPNTENIIFLEYDMPIFIYNNKEDNRVKVGYVGVTLTKVEDSNVIVELDQGSRKVTNYENRSAVNGDNFFGVSVASKAVDQLSNTGTVEKKVKYKLFAYIEKSYFESFDKEVYFGNADGEIESLGIGIFNAVHYEKVISPTK